MQKELQVPSKTNLFSKLIFSLVLLSTTLLSTDVKSQVYDLALINGISADFSTHYCPGDEVRFNTVLYNTGDVQACNLQITAYIPEGMSVSSNPLNSIWTINGSIATANVPGCIPPGGVYPNAASDPLSAFLVLELDNPPSSTITFYSEISQDDGDDIDSTPDTNPANDAIIEGVIFGGVNDEDDHDLTTIVVREDCVSTGCTDPCASNFDSTATQDDGSCAAYSTACNVDICAGDVTVWNPAICGCQVSVTQILGCTNMAATNYNASANCDDGSCMLPAPPPQGDYDLALITGISSSYATTYCPGDEVRFNTVIYNMGEIEACSVEITAYIPAGMSVSNNPLNSIWTVNGSTAIATINSCIPPGGTYPNAGTDPLSAFLILEITGNPGMMINFYSEISQDDGDDIDSTPDNDPNNDAGAIPNTSTDNSIYGPDDEDDHDVAAISIGNCNIGCTDPCAPNYDSAAITDDGSCLAYSTACNVDICAGDVTVWNPAMCGCQVSVAQVLGCTNMAATNYNASANCDDGSCMLPAPPPQGDYDLALITGISSTYPTTYCPGDEVRFNTVVYNTGDIEACNVEITAYIPAGMSVSNNPLNSIWMVNGSTATAMVNGCIPPGGTYPNASTDPLSAFLILEITGDPGTMINFYSEISQDDGEDIDSTPDNDPNNDAYYM